MNLNLGGGFSRGLRTGWDIGNDIERQYKDDKLKEELGAASKANIVEQQTSGDEALQHFQDNYVPQEGGPATAQEYLLQNPEIVQGLGSRKAGASVKGQLYGSTEDAETAARGLNMRGMAKVYAANGRPEDALRLESAAQDTELKGLQVKSAKRKDTSEAFQEQLDTFIRGSRELDDEGFLSGLAKLASDGKADGQGFTYATDPQTGKVFISQHDRGSRKEVARVEWDGDRGKLINEALKYSSAAAYDKARQEEKGDKRWDQEFGLKKDEIDIKRPYYASAAREHDAKAGYWARMPFGGGGGGSASKHDWAPIGEDKDGVPVFLDKKQFDPSKPGTGLVRVDGKPVQDSVGIYRKFTGNKEQKSGLTALGSTGLVTDGQNTYALGNDGRSLVPVELPAKPGAFAMPDPNAQRTAAAAAELGGLSDTALGLRASAGDRAAAAEIQRRARAIEEEDRLSRRGLR